LKLQSKHFSVLIFPQMLNAVLILILKKENVWKQNY
jgi:hypothetical protein